MNYFNRVAQLTPTKFWVNNVSREEAVQPMVHGQLQDKPLLFNQAFNEGGLTTEEFEEYGPVMYFRDNFIKSWVSAVELVSQVR